MLTCVASRVGDAAADVRVYIWNPSAWKAGAWFGSFGRDESNYSIHIYIKHRYAIERFHIERRKNFHGYISFGRDTEVVSRNGWVALQLEHTVAQKRDASRGTGRIHLHRTEALRAVWASSADAVHCLTMESRGIYCGVFSCMVSINILPFDERLLCFLVGCWLGKSLLLKLDIRNQTCYIYLPKRFDQQGEGFYQTLTHCEAQSKRSTTQEDT